MSPTNQMAENQLRTIKTNTLLNVTRNYFARQPCFTITFLLFLLPPYFTLISQNAQISAASITKNGPSGITQTLLICSLEKIGLLEQVEDPRDNTLKLVSFSEHGKKFAEKIDQIAIDATQTIDYLENEFGLYLSKKILEAELALREKISKSAPKLRD